MKRTVDITYKVLQDCTVLQLQVNKGTFDYLKFIHSSAKTNTVIVF